MESGTTGLAALELHREFIGIEKNEDTFNKAKNRIVNNNKVEEFSLIF
jgi:DNA modification methylase